MKSMNNSTFASLFTGFGGADLGAIDAGLVPIWGIEKDRDIGIVGQSNLYKNHCITFGDIRDVAFSNVTNKPDWLHASPPCTTATVVNKKGESQEDIELAEAVCRAIEILQPEYFSLENVAGYLNYKSFDLIRKQLFVNNYNRSTVVLDCSDYGVPQTRKRLFLIASKNESIFDWNARLKPVEKKISWYDAITDLIPTLPEWHLTDSQKERLTEYFNQDITQDSFKIPNLAIQNAGNRKKDGEQNHTIRFAYKPVFTLKAMSGNIRVNPHQVTLVVDGKVLRTTIECYARWQSFPYNYQFSGDFKLDMRGVGNAVPPLMFSQIVRSVLNA